MNKGSEGPPLYYTEKNLVSSPPTHLPRSLLGNHQIKFFWTLGINDIDHCPRTDRLACIHASGQADRHAHTDTDTDKRESVQTHWNIHTPTHKKNTDRPTYRKTIRHTDFLTDRQQTDRQTDWEHGKALLAHTNEVTVCDIQCARRLWPHTCAVHYQPFSRRWTECIRLCVSMLVCMSVCIWETDKQKDIKKISMHACAAGSRQTLHKHTHIITTPQWSAEYHHIKAARPFVGQCAIVMHDDFRCKLNSKHRCYLWLLSNNTKNTEMT